MENTNYDPVQSVNPAKLADDTVLTLSSMQRGSTTEPESLKEGVRLCDYLLHLIEQLRAKQSREERPRFHTVQGDKKAMTDSGIEVNKAYERTEMVKKWINDLIENPSSHSQEDIEAIKEHLMRITMPMWRNRTSEFRERKMKRSLTIHG